MAASAILDGCVGDNHGQTYCRNSVPDCNAVSTMHGGLLQHFDSRVEFRNFSNNLVNMSTMAVASNLRARLAKSVRTSRRYRRRSLGWSSARHMNERAVGRHDRTIRSWATCCWACAAIWRLPDGRSLSRDEVPHVRNQGLDLELNALHAPLGFGYSLFSTETNAAVDPVDLRIDGIHLSLQVTKGSVDGCSVSGWLPIGRTTPPICTSTNEFQFDWVSDAISMARMLHSMSLSFMKASMYMVLAS